MKEELREELPPILRDLNNAPQPGRVPEGYFEGLEDQIFKRLQAEAAPPKRLRLAWLNPRTLSAAAACALLLSAWFFWPNFSNRGDVGTASAQPGSTASEPAEFTAELAAAYVEENIMDFDPELLAQVGQDGANQDMNTPETSSDKVPKKSKKKKSANEELDELLDELTDEELEDLL